MEEDQKSSPLSSLVQLSSYLTELLRFTLSLLAENDALISHSLPRDFCAELLRDEPTNPGTWVTIDGDIPNLPLYKELAVILYKAMLSSTFPGKHTIMPGTTDNQDWELKVDKWMKHITSSRSQLTNLLERTKFHINVQEPFFTQLRYGQKVVEGRCALGDYMRISPGDFLLVNKCLLLLVQAVKWYASFLEMLESEKIENVLPGIQTLEEGVQVYRRFYSEEKERDGGVLAIHISRSPVQPYIIVSNMISTLHVEGIMAILGHKNATSGSSQFTPTMLLSE